MADTEKDERSFNKRLMDAMAEMENPTKGKTAKVPTKNGGSYQYNYESLDQVLEIVDPALANNGLRQRQRQGWHEGCNSFVLETIVFDDTEERIMDTRPIKPQADAQKDGSYETYMRRYALKTVFGLAGEDDDGAATKSTNTQNPTPKRNTAAQSDVFKGAKVTEMASDGIMAKLDAKVDQLAELKGKTAEEVRNALMDSKTMKGADYSSLTAQQANAALCLLVKWLGDANASNLADDDYEF